MCAGLDLVHVERDGATEIYEAGSSDTRSGITTSLSFRFRAVSGHPTLSSCRKSGNSRQGRGFGLTPREIATHQMSQVDGSKEGEMEAGEQPPRQFVAPLGDNLMDDPSGAIGTPRSRGVLS